MMWFVRYIAWRGGKPRDALLVALCLALLAFVVYVDGLAAYGVYVRVFG